MSFRYPVDLLTAEQIKLIQTCLTITLADPSKDKKWMKPRPSAPKPQLTVFRVDEKKNVLLPFFFARKLFSSSINLDKPHCLVIKDYTPRFEATLRDYQGPVALEALELLRTHSTVTLGLRTGWGKSLLGAWLWYMCGLLGVVLIHLDVLIDQWVATFEKAIPALAGSIWVVGEKPPPSIAVIICMEGRVKQIPEHIRQAVGTLIVDECHLFCTSSRIDPLLHFEPRYVIAESATLERNDAAHAVINSFTGLHAINRIPEDPYTIYCLDTGILVPEVMGAQGVRFEQLCKELAADEKRNAMIVDLVRSNPHRKILIITRVKSHVPLLSELLEKVGIIADTIYGKKGKCKDTNVKILSLSKGGVGFDEENAIGKDFGGVKSDTVIFAHTIKNYQSFEQAKGRARGKGLCVIWLRDKNAIPRRHLTELRGWIDNTGGTIIKSKYTNSFRLP